jgi:hypothetical protein
MVLKPLNAASRHCCPLKINVDDTVPRVVYVCKDTSCSAHGDNAFSSFPDTVCKCGKVMESSGQCLKYDGVFLCVHATSLRPAIKHTHCFSRIFNQFEGSIDLAQCFSRVFHQFEGSIDIMNLFLRPIHMHRFV